MLNPYTGVDTPVTTERHIGVKEALPGLVIRGRVGAGVNGEAAALASILLNNGNTVGTGLDKLLGSALGLNRVKLAAVGSMGIKYQGSTDIIPRYGEAWYNTEDIYRLGQSSKVIPIDNSTTVISTIDNNCKLGEILEDIMLSPYGSQGEMEQYEKEGTREFFLQLAIGNTSPLLFALSEKKRPIVRILHSETKYVGEFGV